MTLHSSPDMDSNSSPNNSNLFPKLLLASKSPRRHQLLRDAGFQFDYIDIDADEDFPPTLPPEEICMFLAKHKSMHHAAAIADKVLVTADTIVYINGQVLNKPQTVEEAHDMLRTLSNQTHSVYTGVCLRNEEKVQTFFDRTDVTFHPLTDEQIAYYVEHYKPFDKAGSYGVQDWMGYVGVKGIQGCFYNVMGFPVAKFYRELSAFCQG
jgi:septum formation protein